MPVAVSEDSDEKAADASEVTDPVAVRLVSDENVAEPLCVVADDRI